MNKREVIKVYNPENLNIFDQNIIDDLNEDTLKKEHGAAKFIHGISKNNFDKNLREIQNKDDIPESFELVADQPEIFKSSLVGNQKSKQTEHIAEYRHQKMSASLTYFVEILSRPEPYAGGQMKAAAW